jgi:hypothetical protein
VPNAAGVAGCCRQSHTLYHTLTRLAEWRGSGCVYHRTILVRAPKKDASIDRCAPCKSAHAFGTRTSVCSSSPCARFYVWSQASTPGCTRQACGFRDNLKAFTDAGVTVYGVSLVRLGSTDCHRRLTVTVQCHVPENYSTVHWSLPSRPHTHTHRTRTVPASTRLALAWHSPMYPCTHSLTHSPAHSPIH